MGNFFGRGRVEALREVVHSLVRSGTSNLTANEVRLARTARSFALRLRETLVPFEINRNLFLI